MSFICLPLLVNRREICVSGIESLHVWQEQLTLSSDWRISEGLDAAITNRVLFTISLNDNSQAIQTQMSYIVYLDMHAVLLEDWVNNLDKLGVLLDQCSARHPKVLLRCKDTDWRAWSRLKYRERVSVALDITENATGGALHRAWMVEPVEAIFFTSNQKPCAELHPTYDQVKWTETENFKNSILINTPSLASTTILDNHPVAPLQPLRDNLASSVYRVFERDLCKYNLYQDAIEASLRHLQKLKSPLLIGVLGGGRGPIVERCVRVLDELSLTAKVMVIEKNVNACLALLDRFSGDPRVSVQLGDMRDVEGLPKFDLIVSELLGSFGDNELAPECLWPAEVFLSEIGICIPKSYTSYVEPCYAPTVRRKCADMQAMHVCRLTRALLHKSRTEQSQPVFCFHHPSLASERKSHLLNKIRFTIDEPYAVIDGLVGYFSCVLANVAREGCVTMSTRPEEQSSGLESWYPVYFPLQEPLHLENAAPVSIAITIERVRKDTRVWYEWKCEGHGVDATITHNAGGTHQAFAL